MSPKNFVSVCPIRPQGGWLISSLLLVLGCVALAEGGAAQTNATVLYEGTAKNKAEEVITVTIDLTEKEGALSGVIHSSHGDFAITGGSRQADAVTIDFDAGGSPGTLALRRTGDKLVGTWSAGDDGGSIEVKKAATPEGGTKGKS